MEVQLRRLGPNSKIKILKVSKECRLKVWLAGRGTSCQIYTKSKYASRQHFSITYREQKYFISDLGSANGTFLNDEKVVAEKMLNFGNIISVGVPSEMQDSPDCIVYVFELHSAVFSAEKCLTLFEKDITLEAEESLKLKEMLDQSIINTRVVDAQPKYTSEQLITEFFGVDKSTDNIEKSDMNENSSSDVDLIETLNEPKKISVLSINELEPTKVGKQKINETVLAMKQKEGQAEVEINEHETKTNLKEINSEDEDIFAYDAPTQVDEPQVKTDLDFQNYSLTEELVEISDCEDDWSAKPEESKLPGEDEDEDDDIVVVASTCKSEDSTYRKVGDELTDLDKKWMGNLWGRKNEKTGEGMECDEQEEIAVELDEREVIAMEVDEQEKTVMVIDEQKVKENLNFSVGAHNLNITSCVVRLNRLSEHEIRHKISDLEAKTLPRVEVSHKIIKKVMPKKSVRFDVIPQIKYYEVSFKPRLTDSEKGRLRFARIIFNICNWNTHWLKECKRIAPNKFPPGICEERLRKIPKKFSSHSDYMVAFIPAVLHSLWSKIRAKWLNFGSSGFRQTVSCDSSEDYHCENLSVYKCTGLVQNVAAHKLLVREGDLVLLRLHQIQNLQYKTPATEKYSKKLGYLVFGFVENTTYERYYSQPLHKALAERCVVGDLHIVTITILVKKRPSFQIDKKKLIQLTAVQHISHEIRIFKSICFLPDSPLCSAILKPSECEFPLIEPGKNKNLFFKGPVDDCQREIIIKLSHTFFSKDSFLYSIHGAAGSGKGQVIIGLILQLLYSDEWKHKRPKIVYCTQWSIPLDEMVVKLKSFRQAVEEPFKLVRVGPIREVKPEVRDLCVSNLASSLRSSDKRVGNLRFDAEIEVIKEADVICTTLISSGMPNMCAAFEKLFVRDKNQKIICIIDEAMSCREADSLVPLLLNVTHLLLVGDIYQLEPSFSGEKMHSLGLDMSLFWRIYKNFVNLPEDSWPIYILKTQYRMNSNLSNFTGQLIYNNPLQKPVLNITNRIKNIRSHLLLVIQTFENEKEEMENQEVRTVSKLMRAVTKLAKANGKNIIFRFAVIVCDSKYCEYLQSLLPKRDFPEIEIGQIQAFQGREFDVVTFVYDGWKIIPSWLATALTRARSSLFIFASEKSIHENSFFEKLSVNAIKNGFLRYVQSDVTVEDFELMIKES